MSSSLRQLAWAGADRTGPLTRHAGGRRPGGGDSRADVLAAARRLFGERGFAGTTIRAVAGEAKVDPALVHHFFGTKDDLMSAVLSLPVDLRTALPATLDGDPEGAGERLTRFYLGMWEDPATREPLLAMIRSAVSHEEAATLMRDFLSSQLFGWAGRSLCPDRPELRTALAAAQLAGIGVTRYVVGVATLVAVDLEDLVAAVAPSVQRYLTGPL